VSGHLSEAQADIGPPDDGAVLAVDAGQSGCRFRLTRADGTVESWTGAGLPAGAPSVVAVRGFLLESVCDRGAVPSEPVVRVAAGVTGLHAGAHGLATAALGSWSERLGTRELWVADDAVTSYLGALGDRDGAVVAAGTGVTVLARGPVAPAVRVNGWGPTLGDEGGGYWVGQEGLRLAYRHLDGRTGSARLAELATQEFGDLAGLPAALAQSPRRVAEVAGFSRQVARAAEDGDAAAAGIWRAAAQHLADAVLAALRTVRAGASPHDQDAVTVSWTGALFRAGPLLLEPLAAALAEADTAVALAPPISDALAGAAALPSLRSAGSFGTLVDIATTT
jgi:N-acetylglucosamine kinase-like BadF-type ATPase